MNSFTYSQVVDSNEFGTQLASLELDRFWLTINIYCGDEYKQIAKVARLLAGIISSSSSVERLFSSMGFTWSKLRNRLRSEVVKQICFVRQRMLQASGTAVRPTASLPPNLPVKNMIQTMSRTLKQA